MFKISMKKLVKSKVKFIYFKMLMILSVKIYPQFERGKMSELGEFYYQRKY